jgi:hypothetical protein
MLGAIVVVLGRIIPGLLAGQGGGGENFAQIPLIFIEDGFLVTLLINEIPFLAVAGLLFWLQRMRMKGEIPPVAIWGGVWVGLGVLAATIFWVHLLTWQAVFHGGEGASTSVIALFLAPIYGSLAWLLGFTVGTLGFLFFAHR